MILPIEKLDTPIKTISGVKGVRGVGINQRGEIIVTENSRHCVSVFSPTGEKLRSFGSHSSEHGQFKDIYGIAVDNDSNIATNSRIRQSSHSKVYIRWEVYCDSWQGREESNRV